MGQYYQPVIIDENNNVTAAMYSHEYGNGLKLMEHSYIGNNFVESFETLLALDGAHRVVWAGDYAAPEGEEKPDGTPDNLYFRVSDDKLIRIDHPNFTEAERYGQNGSLTPNMKVPFAVTAESHPFILNHDRKEYVDKRDVPFMESSWSHDMRIHPLPLLTCEGNGLGGGDYRGDDDPRHLIGSWARDRISVSANAPVGVGWNEIAFDLVER